MVPRDRFGRRAGTDTPSPDTARRGPLRSRRGLLRTGAAAGALVLASGLGSAKQDMDPYVFGVTEAALAGGTVVVSGPCEVPDPPEEVALHVQVRGARGARATGRATVTCERESDTFTVPTRVRGAGTFEHGEAVTVCATARVDPADEPAGVVRWCKGVDLV